MIILTGEQYANRVNSHSKKVLLAELTDLHIGLLEIDVNARDDPHFREWVREFIKTLGEKLREERCKGL